MFNDGRIKTSVSASRRLSEDGDVRLEEGVTGPLLSKSPSSIVVPTAGPTTLPPTTTRSTLPPKHPPQTQTRPNGGASGFADGTLTILVLLSVIFCFVYSPRLLRRCDPRYVEQRRRRAAQMAAARAAEEEAIRTIIGGMSGRSADERGMHGMTLEDRRDFVSNVLVTKKVLSLADKSTPLGQGKKRIVLPKRVSSGGTPNSADINTNPSLNSPEPSGSETACAICMEDYEEGDEVCWSHNERCLHAFHRECIIEWLVRHDDCPCCRLNFLSLNGDSENITGEHEQNNGPSGNDTGSNDRNNSTGATNLSSHVPALADDGSEDTSAFHRGMSMFHRFSRETGHRDVGPAAGSGVEMATTTTGGDVFDNPGNGSVADEVSTDGNETEMRNEEGVVRPFNQT